MKTLDDTVQNGKFKGRNCNTKKKQLRFPRPTFLKWPCKVLEQPKNSWKMIIPCDNPYGKFYQGKTVDTYLINTAGCNSYHARK